jgi:hypothetical protein
MSISLLLSALILDTIAVHISSSMLFGNSCGIMGTGKNYRLNKLYHKAGGMTRPESAISPSNLPFV